MKKIVFIFFVYSLTFSYFFRINANSKIFIINNLEDNYFIISDSLIIANTLEIYQNNKSLDKNFYSFDYLNSSIILKNNYFNIGDTLKIVYENSNILLNNRIFRVNNFKTYSDTVVITKNNLIENQNIKISGEKNFNISLNSKNNVGIEQGLNVKIWGEAGKDYKVEGFISDKSNNIGDNEFSSLRIGNINDIYLKIYNNSNEIYFGDRFFKNNDYFINYSKNLRGIFGKFLTNKNDIKFVYGATRFEKKIYKLNPINGYQGYYYISVEGLGDNIQILVNSEEVYLNGKIMEKGEDKDYIFDYENGKIYFTNKHIISENDNILIYFECISGKELLQDYLESGYKYNLNNFSFGLNYYREKDNLKYGNYSFISDDSLRSIISNFSGSDLSISGVIEADSLGDYILIQTENISYYQFVGQGKGNYKIYFYYIGNNQGDYIKSNNYFVYVGENKGDYTIYHKIYLPKLKQNISLDISYNEKDKYYFSNRFVYSLYDDNNLSPNNKNIKGYINNLRLNYNFEKIRFGINWYKINKYKSIGEIFTQEEKDNYKLNNNTLPSNIINSKLDLILLKNIENNINCIFINYSNIRHYLLKNIFVFDNKTKYYLRNQSDFSLENRILNNFTNKIDLKIKFNNNYNLINNIYFYIYRDSIELWNKNFNIVTNLIYENYKNQINLTSNYFYMQEKNSLTKIIRIGNNYKYFGDILNYYFYINLNKNLITKSLNYDFSKKIYLNNFYNLNYLQFDYNLIHREERKLINKYIFVGENLGNYSYDEYSNSYYYDEKGSYKLVKEYIENNIFKYNIIYDISSEINLDEKNMLGINLYNDLQKKEIIYLKDFFTDNDNFNSRNYFFIKRKLKNDDFLKINYIIENTNNLNSESSTRKINTEYCRFSDNRSEIYKYENFEKKYNFLLIKGDKIISNYNFENSKEIGFLLEKFNSKKNNERFFAYRSGILGKYRLNFLYFNLTSNLEYYFIKSNYIFNKLPIDICEGLYKGNSVIISLRLRNNNTEKNEISGFISTELNKRKKFEIQGNISITMYF